MHGNRCGSSVHPSQQTVFYVYTSPSNAPFCILDCALQRTCLRTCISAPISIYRLRDISSLCSSTWSFCSKKITVILKLEGTWKQPLYIKNPQWETRSCISFCISTRKAGTWGHQQQLRADITHSQALAPRGLNSTQLIATTTLNATVIWIWFL